MQSLNGNWIDLVILIFLFYFAYESWGKGLLIIVTDFISFLGSLFIALRAYKFTGGLLKSNFALSNSLANALGYLVTVLLSGAVLNFLISLVLTKLPKKIWKNKWNKALGLLVGVAEGVILVSFVLTLLVSLPLRPSIKKDITDSKIGGFVVTKTAGLEKSLNEIFGEVINDSLTYVTVEPGKKETVQLTNVDSDGLQIDEEAEGQMFAMTNEERKKRGIAPLIWDPKIVPVARNYATDMWERHYFSHYSPEGEDVGFRLKEAGIGYSFAGENLALAPTVVVAQNGLMNSEGHRANILEPKFTKVGIGVISNGYEGLMIVEVFTD